MKSHQHLWSMTAIISTLLLGNLAIGLVNAQQTPPVPGVVTAREFRVVNARNHIVAKTNSGVDGRARIALMDDEYRADGTIVESKIERLEIAIGEAGRPLVQLNDEAGKPRLSLRCVEHKGDNDAPSLEILDYQNKVRGSFGINPNNNPDLQLSGASGQGLQLKIDRVSIYENYYSPSTTLFVARENRPGLAIADSSGKWIWTAPPRQSARPLAKKRIR